MVDTGYFLGASAVIIRKVSGHWQLRHIHNRNRASHVVPDISARIKSEIERAKGTPKGNAQQCHDMH
jgi:hypothetical protein